MWNRLGALSPSLVSKLLSATSGRMPAMVHGATLAGRRQGGARVKSVCLNESNTDTHCVKDCVLVDTDTVSLGGHGTYVVSIAARQATTDGASHLTTLTTVTGPLKGPSER
jgi:hypothetical protein